MRLIDADLLEKEKFSECMDAMDFMAIIDNQPTVEERKQGEWVEDHCSICGCDIPAYIIDSKWQKDMDAKYCPNCGADMRCNKVEKLIAEMEKTLNMPGIKYYGYSLTKEETKETVECLKKLKKIKQIVKFGDTHELGFEYVGEKITEVINND